jgi:hypothetical protein
MLLYQKRKVAKDLTIANRIIVHAVEEAQIAEAVVVQVVDIAVVTVVEIAQQAAVLQRVLVVATNLGVIAN